MPLILPEDWIWDFWFGQDGADYHLFYLRASRSLCDPDLRHWNVSIGHAVSQDLINWVVLPDALKPSPSPAWDDFTTWTGSILQHKGLWHLFYTGSSNEEKGLIQRIGLATSTDLLHWKKYSPNPLIEADPRWYEMLDSGLWHDQAWRDPWVFWHENQFYALITARANFGPADQRGVIAQARSSDLIHWEVLPPLTAPGEFGQMEVPQLVNIQGGYYLLFSCDAEHLSQQRIKRLGGNTGTYYLYAESPLGPFRFLSDQPLLGDKIGTNYSGKIIQGPDEKWYIMAFHNLDKNGNFIGELGDPIPVNVSSDRSLELGRAP